MGIFRKKSNFFDQFFEEPEKELVKPKKTSFFDQFFEEKVEFADTEAMEEMAENLSEKIRKKEKI